MHVRNLRFLKKILKTVVTESAESRLTALEIITKNTSVLKDEIVENLYSYKYMTSRINLIKNQKYGFNNKMLDDIHEFLKQDRNGNTFVIYDNRSINGRIVIMFSDISVEYFNGADVILIDGTFWSVPSHFFQLCTFKVKVYGNLVPLVYILLPNKQETNYIEAFLIQNTLINISVSYINTDFEIGLINALKKSFECKMGRVAVHLGQSEYRKIQRCGFFQ
ncbi:hypothetical protein DMUE_0437 [Dictyocoela muelleri]|nr:hypothetical protein DMUE_0437 [Dictyocoela muelleri]